MNISLKSLKITKPVLAAIVLSGLAFGLVGYIAGHGSSGDDNGAAENSPSGTSGKRQKYVCSMNISFHPYFESYDPEDKCGYCSMDLIPADEEGDDLGPRQMTMSESALKLADVMTVSVERRFVDMVVPLSGKVDYDETRVKTISSRVAGRLDRLFVDYTGIKVRKGDHLVEIYSPELYSAQEELVQALKTASATKNSASEHMVKGSIDTLEAVREKLRLLGLQESQIKEIEKRKEPSAHIEIQAPIGGVVIHKNAREGMYVETGSPIYTVADLSKLWVMLDVYESDLALIKYGQDVEVMAESYGDRVFKGWISFIDPVLDPKTRTVKVRVLVDNPDGILRPNMFVRARVKVQVGADGAVLSSELDGKWICPMHPEIVENSQTPCKICGMDLVQAESLGYTAEDSAQPPLVVPDSSLLITGKRALVYLRIRGGDKPKFEGREVSLGPRAGDYYIIRSGLKEGDEVVVNGSFKIDSALQLMAKPSMMSPDGGSVPPMHHGSHDAGEAQMKSAEHKKQTHCPVMGGEINKEVFADYDGYRVYFCCPGCDAAFKKDPMKYIREMQGKGIELERTGKEEAHHEQH